MDPKKRVFVPSSQCSVQACSLPYIIEREREIFHSCSVDRAVVVVCSDFKNGNQVDLINGMMCKNCVATCAHIRLSSWPGVKVISQ